MQLIQLHKQTWVIQEGRTYDTVYVEKTGWHV